jgi:hypothetical protein
VVSLGCAAACRSRTTYRPLDGSPNEEEPSRPAAPRGSAASVAKRPTATGCPMPSADKETASAAADAHPLDMWQRIVGGSGLLDAPSRRSTPPQEKIASFNFMRLLAAWHIVLFHTMGDPPSPLIEWGGLWVCFFFALSGFVQSTHPGSSSESRVLAHTCASAH